MPRTVESIVESRQAASALRAAGRPIWSRRIDVKSVWNDEDLEGPDKFKAVAAIVKASGWSQESEYVAEIVDNLADAEDDDEFNNWWDALYDEADRDRVWIGTF